MSRPEAYDGARQGGQQRVDGDEQLRVAEGRGDGHDEVGRTTREAAPGGDGRGRAVGDRDGLGEASVRVERTRTGVGSVVPRDGVGSVRHQAPGGPRTVGEVPVLAAVGGEGLVEAADLVVPPPAAREDGADDEAVAGVIGVQQVAAVGVRLAEPGRLRQLPRGCDLLDGGVRRGAGEVGVPSATHDQRLGEGLGKGHHALDEVRLGGRVGIEQHQQLTGARRDAEVAGGRCPEAVVVLPHDADARRDPRHRAGPVVGHHDLVRRARLAAQGRERAVELVLLLEVGDHHRHAAAARAVGCEVPAVARHGGPVGRRRHPTDAHHAR